MPPSKDFYSEALGLILKECQIIHLIKMFFIIFSCIFLIFLKAPANSFVFEVTFQFSRYIIYDNYIIKTYSSSNKKYSHPITLLLLKYEISTLFIEF